MAAITTAELAERARKIRHLERERQANAERECETIAEMGKILIDTKERMDHGKWIPWAERHLPFSLDTAERYMVLARNSAALRNLFPLGKTVVYELAELPAERLKGLTPNSRIRGERLRDMNCAEIHRAFSRKRSRERAAHASDCIKYLATIRAKNPAIWTQIADDVAALLGDGRPEPIRTTGTLPGATREARGRELVRRMREVYDLVDDVDDVGGQLPGAVKIEAMRISQATWREVNKLPAFVTLHGKQAPPQGWRRATGGRGNLPRHPGGSRRVAAPTGKQAPPQGWRKRRPRAREAAEAR